MKRVCILSSVHLALDNRVFYREARSLQRAGYRVTLIAVHPADEVRDGIEIVALPHLPRLQRPRLWLTLLRRAREAQADIYHFHDPELLLVTPWLRRLTGKPTLYDVHEAYEDFIEVKEYIPAWARSPTARAVGWLHPLLARLQSGLIFSDDEIARAFAGVDRPKTTLLNLPARFFIEEAARCSRDGHPRQPVVLHLGGHERNRGALLMIEAFQQVLQTVPRAHLLLVGHFEPPDLEWEVKDEIARRGMGSAVTVTGRVPFEAVGDYLRRAAVGWVPWQPVAKNQKNIPTKLFEYMAHGLPVVCSDLDSTRRFVEHGATGHRVAATEPAAHAEALRKLLEEPEVARKMGRSGQELVRTRYNWDAMEERLLGLYEGLLS
jgi:glycosyltransferase involved in cell wall biosynthesis